MKYPRTPHLPFSKGRTPDDIAVKDFDIQKYQICTEKLDGENTNMTRDKIHARSEEGYNNTWQTYLKKKWAEIRFNIPENLQICGENLYATHSITYEYLPAYFYVFAIFDLERNVVLSYNDMCEWCQLLDLPMAPLFDFDIERDIPHQSHFGSTCEGYVIRNINEFNIEDFADNVAKCVRPNHVQTNRHWTKDWEKAELYDPREHGDILLSREDFSKEVFKRDNYTCVMCDNPAVDAHHLFDRKLFDDGGYYINNGVSLCEEHHIDAEKSILSLEKLRYKSIIVKTVYPRTLNPQKRYDKWGKEIYQTGELIK